MIDIYGTGYLNRVVDSLKRTPAFILNSFFNQVETSDSETIFFDVELDGQKRRLAPVVHPLVEGKVVESLGYETKSFKPAYIKDKRVHDATRPFKRAAGEQIGTGQELSPEQRRQLSLLRDLRDQVDILTRRLEVWGVEALTQGTITVNMLMPDGNTKTVSVNFGRSASQTITLAAGSKWGDAGVDPINDLEDWSLQTLQLSGSSVRNIIMDPQAWRAFRKSVSLQNRLDLRRVDSGQINLGIIPDHVQYKGSDGTFDYWVYADWYLADGATTEQVMLPAGTVIGVGDLMGVRHFGAIKDEAAGFQSREYFVKSWVQEDPSARYLLMQSAPLLVPYRPNASFAAAVI